MENLSQSQFGPFLIDVRERVLRRNGRPVPLTPKAFDVLATLVEQPGRLLSKEELLQKVWPDTFVEESNLAYNVFALRKALGDTADNGEYIETVAKRGYRFIATVTPVNRRNGGTLSSKGAAEAPVPEPLTAGTEFHTSGRQPRPPATSDVRRYVPSGPLRAAVWFAAGVICASGGVLLMIPRQAVPTPSVIRAQIATGVQLSEASPFAASPDGQQLAFAGTGSDGVTRLWVRRIDAEVSRPLPGTEAALGGLTPPMFWSPDSQSVAFDAAGELKRIDVRGGAARTVCDLPNLAVGGSWNADGVIVVGQPTGGLLRCSSVGGPVSEVTRIDTTKGEGLHIFPSFLQMGDTSSTSASRGWRRKSPECTWALSTRSRVLPGEIDCSPQDLARHTSGARGPRRATSCFFRTRPSSHRNLTSGRFSSWTARIARAPCRIVSGWRLLRGVAE